MKVMCPTCGNEFTVLYGSKFICSQCGDVNDVAENSAPPLAPEQTAPTEPQPLPREQQIKTFSDNELLTELSRRGRFVRCKAEEIITPEHWADHYNDDDFKQHVTHSVFRQIGEALQESDDGWKFFSTVAIADGRFGSSKRHPAMLCNVIVDVVMPK